MCDNDPLHEKTTRTIPTASTWVVKIFAQSEKFSETPFKVAVASRSSQLCDGTIKASRYCANIHIKNHPGTSAQTYSPAALLQAISDTPNDGLLHFGRSWLSF